MKVLTCKPILSVLVAYGLFHAVLMAQARQRSPEGQFDARRLKLGNFIYRETEAGKDAGQSQIKIERIAVLSVSFGLRYHRDQVGRLMDGLQWSPRKQKPLTAERILRYPPLSLFGG